MVCMVNCTGVLQLFTGDILLRTVMQRVLLHDELGQAELRRLHRFIDVLPTQLEVSGREAVALQLHCAHLRVEREEAKVHVAADGRRDSDVKNHRQL